MQLAHPAPLRLGSIPRLQVLAGVVCYSVATSSMRQAAVQQYSAGHACREFARSASLRSWPHVQIRGAAFSNFGGAVP